MLQPMTGDGSAARAATVYLIRHAEPALWGDGSMRYDAPPGPPLSTHGRTQAAMAANFLASGPPTVVYTSPLDRALQTTQIITARLGVPMAIDERLAEHRRDETNEQVVERLVGFWRERVTTATSSLCVALVSHGSPIRALLASLGDVWTADPERYRFDHGNIAPPAGIWRARCMATNGRPRHWELALVFRTFVAGSGR
jgi:broad specificity phosphatase PhoE